MAEETVTVRKDALDTLLKIKGLMDKAWDDPKKGSAFRRTLKEIEPQIKIPDELADSAMDPIKGEIENTNKTVKAFGDRLDKFLSETKDKEDTENMRAEIDAAQKKYGLDDEGRVKMMTRMKDKANPDAEAAAAYIAAQAPKPKPMTNLGFSVTSADLFGTTQKEDRWNDLHTGGDPFRPGGFFEKEAQAVMDEMSEDKAA